MDAEVDPDSTMLRASVGELVAVEMAAARDTLATPRESITITNSNFILATLAHSLQTGRMVTDGVREQLFADEQRDQHKKHRLAEVGALHFLGIQI